MSDELRVRMFSTQLQTVVVGTTLITVVTAEIVAAMAFAGIAAGPTLTAAGAAIKGAAANVGGNLLGWGAGLYSAGRGIFDKTTLALNRAQLWGARALGYVQSPSQTEISTPLGTSAAGGGATGGGPDLISILRTSLYRLGFRSGDCYKGSAQTIWIMGGRRGPKPTPPSAWNEFVRWLQRSGVRVRNAGDLIMGRGGMSSEAFAAQAKGHGLKEGTTGYVLQSVPGFASSTGKDLAHVFTFVIKGGRMHTIDPTTGRAHDIVDALYWVIPAGQLTIR